MMLCKIDFLHSNGVMYNLPLEILHKIVSVDKPTYSGMLSFPIFARSIDISAKLDFMIEFGYTVHITRGSIIWMKNLLKHRIDGPAVEYSNGEKEWWQNGVLHCNDGPAIICPDGSTWWYENGELHRIGGPQ